MGGYGLNRLRIVGVFAPRYPKIGTPLWLKRCNSALSSPLTDSSGTDSPILGHCNHKEGGDRAVWLCVGGLHQVSLTLQAHIAQDVAARIVCQFSTPCCASLMIMLGDLARTIGGLWTL